MVSSNGQFKGLVDSSVNLPANTWEPHFDGLESEDIHTFLIEFLSDSNHEQFLWLHKSSFHLHCTAARKPEGWGIELRSSSFTSVLLKPEILLQIFFGKIKNFSKFGSKIRILGLKGVEPNFVDPPIWGGTSLKWVGHFLSTFLLFLALFEVLGRYLNDYWRL